MSIERHPQKDHHFLETLRTPAKNDWAFLIHDVAPPQIEIALDGFLFNKQVGYHPSRVTYSPRGVNSLEYLEIDCE